IGVNVGLSNQLAFAASTTFAAAAGGLFAAVQGFVGPESASIDLTFSMLMYVLVGGMGTVMGPIVGAFLVAFIFEMFQDLQSYRYLVLGPIIVALVIFAPRGIVGYLNQLVDKWFASARGSRARIDTPHEEPSEVTEDRGSRGCCWERKAAQNGWGDW